MNTVDDNEWNGDGGVPVAVKCKSIKDRPVVNDWIAVSVAEDDGSDKSKKQSDSFSFSGNPTTDIPNKSSAGSNWIQWYNELKDNFGKKEANSLFLKAWQKRGSSSANTHELRELLSKNGIDLEKGILSSVYDSGVGVIDDISGFLKIGKYALFAVGGITILGFGLALYNIAKNPGATAGKAIKAAL